MNTRHLRITAAHSAGRAARRRVGWRRPLGWSAGILAGLALLGWAGLQVQPQPFPAYPARLSTPEAVPLPAGLPAPVQRFYRQTYGEFIPVITSAVVTGRASLRFIPGGPAFPARFRFVHESGRNYRHYIEATWFGLPLLRVNESYLDGVSRQELPRPFPSSVGDPKGAQGANLGLWSETVWMPSVYLTDPRVHWTAVNDETALLSVPFGEERETYVVRFDPATGRPTLFESMRYHGPASQEKTLWLNQTLDWGEFGGMTLPRESAALWLDQGRPWAVFTTEEVVYNADVREYVRQRGQ
ncbi:hypothetical protein HNQ09_002143 [Deinococcus budaensis]|uniref:Uncharacterized protein n=1 Tax=Deinococcus budaensis TaxID=1665626 RepID=A0A7W8GFP1_9DEIO|nr:DUF6544 family protein [Deinococcus budaensis]MBB5234700.1 hypothetical protein [Deinococcus budaensis]